jgi:hypothetical protein
MMGSYALKKGTRRLSRQSWKIWHVSTINKFPRCVNKKDTWTSKDNSHRYNVECLQSGEVYLAAVIFLIGFNGNSN